MAGLLRFWRAFPLNIVSQRHGAVPARQAISTRPSVRLGQSANTSHSTAGTIERRSAPHRSRIAGEGLKPTAATTPGMVGSGRREISPSLTSACVKRKTLPTCSAGPSASTSSSVAAHASRATPLPGRFNRLAREVGFSVAIWHYLLGESLHITLTYLLYTDRLGVGDIGNWLSALGVPADGPLNRGLAVYNVVLSPRLLLDYAIVNACCYPLIPLELRFCVATAPLIGAPARLIRNALGWGRRRGVSVPKAPSVRP